MIRVVCILLLGLSVMTTLKAHEIRPAYLELKQDQEGPGYSLLWKIPMLNGAIPKIQPVFVDDQVLLTKLSESMTSDALITRYRMTFVEDVSLAGQQIKFDLLERTLMDVLVYIEMQNDVYYTLLAQPDHPYVEVPVEPSTTEVMKTYSFLGVEHILLGFDHLLFVCCLMLLIQTIKVLIQTITAFTIAHSMTLAGATLGWIHIPGPPVEAVIALSIVFLAREYLMIDRGSSSITRRYPWLVAVSFGLLHGFGFAGALGDIGLPQTAIPFALLFFNIGVELGQVMFVVVLLLIFYIGKQLWAAGIDRAKIIMAYGIGALSTFWFIDRLLIF